MPTLNNEIDVLNVANIDNDIRDSFTRALIADEEKETYSTHDYDVNQFFIWNDRNLYRTLTEISTGDTFVVDTNVRRAGKVSDLIYELFSNAPDALEAALTNVEKTANASKNYSAGQYILWTDGFFYEVKVDTAVTTPWAVGTNIVRADNISDILTGMGSAIRTLGAHNLLLSIVEPGGANYSFAGLSMRSGDADSHLIVTAGTSTSAGKFWLSGYSEVTSDNWGAEQSIQAGTYRVSLSGGSSPISLVVKVRNRYYGSESQTITVTGNQTATFTVTKRSVLKAYLEVDNGVSVPTCELYPMVCSVTDKSIEYEDPSMTNVDLVKGRVKYVDIYVAHPVVQSPFISGLPKLAVIIKRADVRSNVFDPAYDNVLSIYLDGPLGTNCMPFVWKGGDNTGDICIYVTDADIFDPDHSSTSLHVRIAYTNANPTYEMLIDQGETD